MKRKVNRVGRNTLTVSLPSNWVKKQNIMQGQEVDVIEENSSLIISKQGYTSSKKTLTLDASDQNIMLHRIIAAIYKSGYDEVYIKYSSSDELKIIQDRLERNLSEFDIVEYKQGLVIVKSISKLDYSQFKVIFKKIFFNLKDIANETLNSFSSQDYKELENIFLRDKIIDKYTDFCRRLMNKGIDIEFNKPFAVYYIIEQTEIIADMYKDLCSIIYSEKSKSNPKLINLFKEVNDFMFLFIDLLFDFNLDKIKRFGLKKEKIEKKITTLYSYIKRNDLKIFFLLQSIFHSVFEMKSSLMVESL